MTTIPEIHSAAETAKLLHKSYGSLAVGRCKRRLKLPYVKIGRKVFYRASDIAAFINSQVVDPTAAPEPASRRGKARR
jgi:hypothetical protein